MFLLRYNFTIENGLLDEKIKFMVEKTSKSIENKCTNCELRLVLIEIPKNILDMLDISRQPSQVISVVFSHQKKQKWQRISVPTV